MDLSGSAYGIALPYSAAAAFGEDAGSGDIDLLRPAVLNSMQHHMNQGAAMTSDGRDDVRTFSQGLRNTLNAAGETLTGFLRAPSDTVPCIANHRTFLTGCTTAGFLSSPSWMTRTLRNVVDPASVQADISGALGLPLDELHAKLRTTMDLYLASIDTMGKAYGRLEAKLTGLERVTHQLLSLPSLPHPSDLATAIYAYAESQYKEHDLEADYTEFCKSYATFQATRSALVLPQSVAGSTMPTCVICMTEPVSCAIVPCGHTFCNKCGYSQKSQCYLCRTPVREKQRLYFT